MSDVVYHPSAGADISHESTGAESAPQIESHDDHSGSHDDHGGSLSVLSAAREITRKRHEEGITAEPVDEINYVDGRAADAEISAKDAASDINEYRAAKAAALLAEMTGEP